MYGVKSPRIFAKLYSNQFNNMQITKFASRSNDVWILATIESIINNWLQSSEPQEY